MSAYKECTIIDLIQFTPPFFILFHISFRTVIQKVQVKITAAPVAVQYSHMSGSTLKSTIKRLGATL